MTRCRASPEVFLVVPRGEGPKLLLSVREVPVPVQVRGVSRDTRTHNRHKNLTSTGNAVERVGAAPSTVHVRGVTLLLAGETAQRRARVRAAAAAAAANSGPIGTIGLR